MQRDDTERKRTAKIPRKNKPAGAAAMLGFAARARGEKGRRTARVMAELREGEQQSHGSLIINTDHAITQNLRALSSALPIFHPAIAASLMLLNGCGTNNRVLEEIFEQVYTIEPSASITIQNRDGAVLIYGSNANEMLVRAVKKGYRRERLSQIAIDVSTAPGSLSIITKFPPQPKWGRSDRSGTVDYTIVVPASASISALDLNAGEVFLEGMLGGEVRARLGDGRMFAHNCFTNLDLTLNRGTLTLSYDWWEEEKFFAKAAMSQGNAWIWMPSNAAFHLLAEVAHGNIANDFHNVSVSANSSGKAMNIDQIINGERSATIKIRVEKGDIKIAEANP